MGGVGGGGGSCYGEIDLSHLTTYTQMEIQ